MATPGTPPGQVRGSKFSPVTAVHAGRLLSPSQPEQLKVTEFPKPVPALCTSDAFARVMYGTSAVPERLDI